MSESGDDSKNNSSAQNSGASPSGSEDVNLLFVSNDDKLLGPTFAFLNKRNWKYRFVTSMKDAFAEITANRPTHVLISCDLNQTSVVKVERAVRVGLKLPCIIFTEKELDPKKHHQISNGGIKQYILAPISGTSVHVKIRSLLQDPQAAFGSDDAKEKAKNYTLVKGEGSTVIKDDLIHIKADPKEVANAILYGMPKQTEWEKVGVAADGKPLWAPKGSDPKKNKNVFVFKGDTPPTMENSTWKLPASGGSFEQIVDASDDPNAPIVTKTVEGKKEAKEGKVLIHSRTDSKADGAEGSEHAGGSGKSAGEKSEMKIFSSGKSVDGKETKVFSGAAGKAGVEKAKIFSSGKKVDGKDTKVFSSGQKKAGVGKAKVFASGKKVDGKETKVFGQDGKKAAPGKAKVFSSGKKINGKQTKVFAGKKGVGPSGIVAPGADQSAAGVTPAGTEAGQSTAAVAGSTPGAAGTPGAKMPGLAGEGKQAGVAKAKIFTSDKKKNEPKSKIVTDEPKIQRVQENFSETGKTREESQAVVAEAIKLKQKGLSVKQQIVLTPPVKPQHKIFATETQEKKLVAKERKREERLIAAIKKKKKMQQASMKFAESKKVADQIRKFQAETNKKNKEKKPNVMHFANEKKEKKGSFHFSISVKGKKNDGMIMQQGTKGKKFSIMTGGTAMKPNKAPLYVPKKSPAAVKKSSQEIAVSIKQKKIQITPAEPQPKKKMALYVPRVEAKAPPKSLALMPVQKPSKKSGPKEPILKEERQKDPEQAPRTRVFGEKKNSILAKSVVDAIEKTVEEVNSDALIPLKLVTHLDCIPINSRNFRGLLMFATSAPQHTGEDFSASIKEHAIAFMKERGETLTDEGEIHLQVEPFVFLDVATEMADFITLTEMNGVELGMAFIQSEKVLPKLEAANGEDMIQVNLEDVRPDEQLNFDAFIHLPLNNKYIKYVRKGATIEARQKENMTEFKVAHFFIKSEDTRAFKHQCASYFVLNMLKGFLQAVKKRAG